MTERKLIPSRPRDLGGFMVGRILPYSARRMVGPFIFLDEMGPASFDAGVGIDVRPHPHIGLATVTYLFEGELMHRDSLGSVQEVTPGDVNWMTAGRGIAHSERTGLDERGHVHKLHGMQSWVALPKEYEECAPEFFHHKSSTLPELELNGTKLRVIAGEAYGKKAPVKIFSPLFYVEAKFENGGTLPLPNEYGERAVYVVSGEIDANGEIIPASTMAVFEAGEVTLAAKSSAHVMLLGGDALSEPRHIYWNFVSSSEARLEQAKDDWRNGRFGKIPGDENEFIPLPDNPGQQPHKEKHG